MGENNTTNRRQFLAGSLGLTGGVTALFGVPKAFAAACGLTPPQTIGPFYPQVNPLDDQNNDLTIVKNATGKPLGTVVYVTGRVVDQDCKPVERAMVEIWQAAESGRYNHSGDTSGLKLDKNFGYFGEMLTDDTGRYAFKTIIPGYYPASGSWFRPPHIHFKISKRGHHDLITQMYFDPKSFSDPKLANKIQDLNDKDLILKAVAKKQAVIVQFDEVAPFTPVEFKKSITGPGGLTYRADKFVTAAGERLGDFEIAITRVI
jgi:protocatechuate 3,4-dioxygenase, beta subunit